MAPDVAEMNRRLSAFESSDKCRYGRVDCTEMSAPERVFSLIWEVENEVNNGGFQQFFYNSGYLVAPDVVDALKAIGAIKTAELAERALAAVGPDVAWSDDEKRQSQMSDLPEQVEDELDALDQAYFARPDDLTALLYRYVAEHRREVGAPDDF